MIRGLLVRVGKSGIMLITVENLERVVVNVVAGCRGEPQRQPMEVSHHLLVDIIDRAVAFIGDDQIEEERRYPGFRCRAALDHVQHGWVSADVDPAIRRESLLSLFRPARLGWQVFLEGVEGLVAQRDAVHQEKNTLSPMGA